MYNKVLAIDSAIGTSGYSIFTVFKGKVIDIKVGNITTKIQYRKTSPPSNLQIPRRINEIYTFFEEIITQEGITHIAIEEKHVGLNKSTVIPLAKVDGALALLSYKYNLHYYTYQPSEHKKKVTGKGNASKEVARIEIKKLLKIKYDITEDEGDALCIGYTCIVLEGLVKEGEIFK